MLPKLTLYYRYAQIAVVVTCFGIVLSLGVQGQVRSYSDPPVLDEPQQVQNAIVEQKLLVIDQRLDKLDKLIELQNQELMTMRDDHVMMRGIGIIGAIILGLFQVLQVLLQLKITKKP